MPTPPPQPRTARATPPPTSCPVRLTNTPPALSKSPAKRQNSKANRLRKSPPPSSARRPPSECDDGLLRVKAQNAIGAIQQLFSTGWLAAKGVYINTYE